MFHLATVADRHIAIVVASFSSHTKAVDKAGAVVETVLPYCRTRGGLWQIKALNHLATVRMKQAGWLVWIYLGHHSKLSLASRI
eukprot:s785_g7.t1